MIRKDRKAYCRVLLPLSLMDAAKRLAAQDYRSLSSFCGLILSQELARRMMQQTEKRS